MSGRRVWWYFMVFFGFIAAVNAVMITLAVKTHTGTITQHPYEKGLAYNQVVSAQAKQEELGWKSALEYKDGILQFALRDKDNQLIVPDKATAAISRPTQEGMDFSAELKGAETPVAFPLKGLWEVRVDVLYKGEHYQQSKRIVVE